MSCTENDSGPYVVLLLPAVVGCLTILLARRWAHSQVTTTSTAISRRRKILKDPLIKRPLPPNTGKMVAAGSKKGGGGAKKALPPIHEEEPSGGGKRSKQKLALATIPEVKTPEVPSPPKHIPFPYIPQDSIILYELMTSIFTIVAMASQYLNIYRTLWWRHNSFTNEAVRLFLIDVHLVALLLLILVRRMLLTTSLFILRFIITRRFWPQAVKGARMFVLGVIVGIVSWCMYHISTRYPLEKLLVLVYPAILYFLLFGMQVSPLIELHNREVPLMHCCSHQTQHVRLEVDTLRYDFNLRIKKILFNAIVAAYYTSFVPCYLAQSFVFFDVRHCAVQTGLVWGALCGRYTVQLLPAGVLDASHRATKHLGHWRKYIPSKEMGESTTNSVMDWAADKWWSTGAVVRRYGQCYVAMTPTVAADPASVQHDRFYRVFNDPSVLICVFLCTQMSLVLMQMCLLFAWFPWHNYIGIISLLFVNYYNLFKMIRDYLISWKVYKAENMIQDKSLCLAIK